jgi:hypothetical protein
LTEALPRDLFLKEFQAIVNYSAPNRYPNTPQVTPATIKPIGGAIRKPPIAVNSINDNINTFAKVGLFITRGSKANIFFILPNLAYFMTYD